jgi:hypothetical protein
MGDFRLTREDELFCGFLRHLVHEEDFTAEQLLNVVERPDRWTPEFLEWKGTRDAEVGPVASTG